MSRPVAISWAFVDHRFPLSSTDQRYQSSGRRSTAVCWDCYPSAASTLGLAWVPRWDHHSTASFNDRTSMVVCQVSKGTCRKDQKSMVFFPIYLDQLLDPGVVVQLSPVCHPRQTGHEHFLAAFGTKFWMSRRERLFGRIGCGEQIRAIRPLTQSSRGAP